MENPVGRPSLKENTPCPKCGRMRVWKHYPSGRYQKCPPCVIKKSTADRLLVDKDPKARRARIDLAAAKRKENPELTRIKDAAYRVKSYEKLIISRHRCENKREAKTGHRTLNAMRNVDTFYQAHKRFQTWCKKDMTEALRLSSLGYTKMHIAKTLNRSLLGVLSKMWKLEHAIKG